MHGSIICYPSSEGRWSNTSLLIATDTVFPNTNLRYAFVPGHIEDGTRNEIGCLSAELKKLQRKCVEAFMRRMWSQE
jgi:hypothetical protein